MTLFLRNQPSPPTTDTDGSINVTKLTMIPNSQSECFNHMLPTLPIRIFQPNDNLLIAFDTRNRNPAFVIERISKHQEVGAAGEAPSRKNKRFFEDKSIPAHHRSRNHHYRNSGYDRGHLAPAADFNTDSEVQDSFSLSNVSPQLPKFNRTMWLRVEEFVRSVAAREEKDGSSETWVMTGPLWLPASTLGKDKFEYSYEAIGHPPSLIHVPTHFFKVVVVVAPAVDATAENDGPQFQLKKFAAFVVPQSDFEERSSRLRLVDCIVRLTDLEAVVGLEFFPNLLGSHVDGNDDDIPLYKELADALTDDVRVDAENNHNQPLLLEDDNTKRDEDGTLHQNNTGLSKRRKKKIKQLLGSSSPVAFRHLCKNNNACFKFL